MRGEEEVVCALITVPLQTPMSDTNNPKPLEFANCSHGRARVFYGRRRKPMRMTKFDPPPSLTSLPIVT